jgi:predicted PurR-regulated permease PerM
MLKNPPGVGQLSSRHGARITRAVRVRTRLPTWFLAALVFAAGYMFYPFLPWMALAMWLGLYGRRVHEPLTRRLGGRTGLSATITVSLLLVLVVPIGVVVVSIVFDAITLVQYLLESEEAKAVFVKLVQNGGPENKDAMDTTSGLIDVIMAQGDRAWAIVQSVAGMAARAVIGLLIMVTGMYGVLVEGKAWYEWLERHTPLEPVHFRRLGDAFMETGRGLWWGIGGAGLLQSIVATIAFIAIGVPSALALGALTLMFSVIPAIGTAIVWVPVAAGLALTGRPIAALSLAIVGVAVIGTVDNLARPWLAHRGKLQLPTWVVLVSMFGGVELIGGWGLLIGPLVVRLAKEALVISREARDPATSSPPVETKAGS